MLYVQEILSIFYSKWLYKNWTRFIGHPEVPNILKMNN